MDIKKYIDTKSLDDILLKSLTRRETEVLGLIATGSDFEDVANIFCVAMCTVKTHWSNLTLKIFIPRTSRKNLKVVMCLFWGRFHKELVKRASINNG